MRIGILTLPLKDNYGGILQNWALQQALKDMGHEPITLDAYMQYPIWRHYASVIKTVMMRIIGIIRPFPPLSKFRRISSKFTCDFIHNNINCTKPFKQYSRDVFESYNIDVLLVGSDQVWRPRYAPNIYNMYLDFVRDINCRKIAYAASFGVDVWEYNNEQTAVCCELVKKFHAVSVREESGISLCKEHLNVDAQYVLDPTLLIDRERYEKICENIPISNERFLAAYCLDITDEKLNLFNQIASEKCLDLKLFSSDGNNTMTIEQWLAIFRDAEFVITDSFHGTLFSIIFKKLFYCINNDERGTARFNSILSTLNLANRMSNSSLKENINWSQVEEKLKIYKDKSLAFIKKNLLT